MTKKKVRKIKAAQTSATSPVMAEGRKPSDTGTSVRKLSAGVQSPAISKVQVLKGFLEDVRAEFNKITWANKKETSSLTVAVLAITIFFSAYLGLVDIALSKLVGILIK